MCFSEMADTTTDVEQPPQNTDNEERLIAFCNEDVRKPEILKLKRNVYESELHSILWPFSFLGVQWI